MSELRNRHVAQSADAPVLVGRGREQALLSRQWADAVDGKGSLVLIGGEAGIGKTALAEALARQAAAHEALVLTGHCYDLTETPPYGPWLDLFVDYSARPGMPALPGVITEDGQVGLVPSQVAFFAEVRRFFSSVAAGSRSCCWPRIAFWDDWRPKQAILPARLRISKPLCNSQMPVLRPTSRRWSRLRVASGNLPEARSLLDEVRAICTPLEAAPALAEADALAAVVAQNAARSPATRGYPASPRGRWRSCGWSRPD